MRKVIIFALILRGLLGSFYYHPDLKSQFFHASFLSRGTVNIYDYLSVNRKDLPYSDTFNYPPLIYFFQGAWHFISRAVIGPGLTDWLWDWSDRHLYAGGLFAYLLVLKLPYLLADLLILKLLLDLAPRERKYSVSLLWLFNPVSLYGIYMVGQFDILPALITVGSFILAKKSRFAWSLFLLGLAAAFKTYPLLLVPFVLLKIPRVETFFRSLPGLAVGYLLPLAPFIFSVSFQSSVFRSGLSGRIVNAPFLLYYFVLLILSFRGRKTASLLWEFMAVTLGVLLFTRFHAQWAIWTLPFAVLLVSVKSTLNWTAAAVVITLFGIVFLIPDQYVLIGLFTPLNPYLAYVPPISQFLPAILAPVFRGAFLISGLLFVFLSRSNEKTV